tara:strand:- start:8447 stop:8728 length:282 start_codon:yes stop_codon:yes gene_type:complete
MFTVNKLLTLIFLIFFISDSYANENRCRYQIIQLGEHLKIMLSKINIMPPIAQIYSPLKGAFDEAIRAQRRGDYTTCINKTNIALKYSRAYTK